MRRLVEDFIDDFILKHIPSTFTVIERNLKMYVFDVMYEKTDLKHFDFYCMPNVFWYFNYKTSISSGYIFSSCLHPVLSIKIFSQLQSSLFLPYE